MGKKEQELLNKERENLELRWGKVQKEQAKKDYELMLQMKNQSFARSLDDADLEHEKKAKIRSGDPMAAAAHKKLEKTKEKKKSKNSKPLYKGPVGKPNRFGISPGYRWDGIMRGNGFEDKVLAKLYGQNQRNEDAYKWR